jgi:hypothetical protein
MGGFVVGSDLLVAAGQEGPESDADAFLSAIKIEDGSNVWHQKLPTAVVKGGLAVDHTGRIFVALDSGKLLCFAGTSR